VDAIIVEKRRGAIAVNKRLFERLVEIMGQMDEIRAWISARS